MSAVGKHIAQMEIAPMMSPALTPNITRRVSANGLESNCRYVIQRLLASDHTDEQGSPSNMKRLKYLALALFQFATALPVI